MAISNNNATILMRKIFCQEMKFISILKSISQMRLTLLPVSNTQPILQDDVFEAIEENRDQFDAEMSATGIEVESV